MGPCCDSCPFSPTCEEEEDWRAQVFGYGDYEADPPTLILDPAE